MTSVFYRFARRKLHIRSLVPRTFLGKLAAFFGLGAVVSLLLWASFWMAGRSAGAEAARGWAQGLGFFALFFGVWVAFRWFRHVLMWRLRNRLIVTYMFIGVIPVLLVVLMALIASYFFAGQFATYLATNDLNKEIESLANANNNVAGELLDSLRRSGQVDNDAPHALQHAQLKAKFAQADVVAWYRGKQFKVQESPSRPEIPYPRWVQDRFSGVTFDEQGKLWIRAVTVAPVTNSESLTVVTSIPVDAEFLKRVAQDTAEVTLYARGDFQLGGAQAENETQQAARSQEFQAGESRSGAALAVNTRDDAEARAKQVVHEMEKRGVRLPSVTAGAVPPQRGRWDYNLTFAAPIPLSEWVSKQGFDVPVLVKTRPSALYRRLSVTSGNFSDLIAGFLVSLALTFAVIEFIALIIGVRLTRSITRSVHNLYQATQHIERGDLRFRIPVKNNDQLAALETSFNQMGESLERLIAEQKEKERLQSEIEIAQEVQAQLFPKQMSDLPTLELHGVCRPARSVSGDYYDFLPFGPDKIGVAVGDVAGKGISAALLMATIHSGVRAYEFGRVPMMSAQLLAASARSAGPGSTHIAEMVSAPPLADISPAGVLTMLNRHLYQTTAPEKYATLFFGLYDGPSRTMTYCNAAHLAALVIGAGGEIRRLESSGLPIGLFDGVTYDDESIKLRPGDIFVAYSDGITEPENEFGEFGEQRLVDLVREHRTLPLARISETVVTAVQDWIGAAEQPDDVTLVLARAR